MKRRLIHMLGVLGLVLGVFSVPALAAPASGDNSSGFQTSQPSS